MEIFYAYLWLVILVIITAVLLYYVYFGGTTPVSGSTFSKHFRLPAVHQPHQGCVDKWIVINWSGRQLDRQPEIEWDLERNGFRYKGRLLEHIPGRGPCMVGEKGRLWPESRSYFVSNYLVHPASGDKYSVLHWWYPEELEETRGETHPLPLKIYLIEKGEGLLIHAPSTNNNYMVYQAANGMRRDLTDLAQMGAHIQTSQTEEKWAQVGSFSRAKMVIADLSLELSYLKLSDIFLP